MQAGATGEARAQGAMYHLWACLITTTGALSGVSPARRCRLVIDLLHLYPQSTYLAAELLRLHKGLQTHAQLRVTLGRLLSAPQAAGSLALGLAAVCGGEPSHEHYVRHAFERALAPLDPLALGKALAQDATGARNGDVAAPSAGLERLTTGGLCWGAAPLQGGLGSLALAPAMWLAYMQWLLAQGHERDARNVFLRAVGSLPWSKQLWMRGLAALGPAVQGTMASELLDVMQSRGIVLLTPVAEVLLEALEEQMGE